MTANALAGDREHYLAAGLDDYISKPLRADALLALLIRAFPDRPLGDSKVGRAKVVDEAPSLQTSGSQYIDVDAPAALPPEMDALTDMIPVLDMEQLEDLIGLPSGIDGDTTPGAHGLIDLFKTKSRERLRLMSSCLVDSNWLLLGDTAHSLRGAAASIGFPRVAEVCKSLELATRRLTPKAGMPMVESDAPMPTQKEVDEMYEKITLHFYEAEAALAKWLAATTANKQLS
jgi:HPt (histidine-containing phosphotransfer) domain-containing protein